VCSWKSEGAISEMRSDSSAFWNNLSEKVEWQKKKSSWCSHFILMKHGKWLHKGGKKRWNL
jgi:hypothetical protein